MVRKDDIAATKLHVVFDVGDGTLNGMSLNHRLMVGKLLQGFIITPYIIVFIVRLIANI
jgi:hypothetical protein